MRLHLHKQRTASPLGSNHQTNMRDVCTDSGSTWSWHEASKHCWSSCLHATRWGLTQEAEHTLMAKLCMHIVDELIVSTADCMLRLHQACMLAVSVVDALTYAETS